MNKRTKENRAGKNKLSKNPARFSTEGEFCVWSFRNVDRNGLFAFDPRRADFDAKDFLLKMLSYSTMTWREIKSQTHDNGKSKHHELNPATLSENALARIRAKGFEESTDALFSFALNNKVRVVGIRKGAEFQVVWYDANHEFAPSRLKHT